MDESDMDPRAILAALAVRDVTAVVPVRGGRDTAIWRVEYGGQSSTLRLFRAGQELRCRREVYAMAAAAAAGIPVPVVRVSGMWGEHPVLLLSWCPGRPLAQELRARPWRARSLGVQAGRTLAAIHRIPATSVPGREAGSWIAGAGPDHSRLQALLRARSSPRQTLLHLDYHLLNVLADGRRITAVLDWANAAAGDPGADLARAIAILRLDTADAEVPRWAAAAVLRGFEAGLLHGYTAVAGSHAATMAPFHAWAGAMMERDLAGWLRPEQQQRIRRWVRMWLARAERA